MLSNPQAVLLAGTPAQIPLPPFPVMAGEQLALAIGVLNPLYATADLATATGDPYPEGQLFQVPGIYTFTPLLGVDLRFATHVTPAQLPTTLALSTLSATGGTPTAVLTAAGVPLPGRTVAFDLRRSDGRVKARCSAVTDTSGRAACSRTRWQIPTGGSVVATFAGDTAYAGSTATVSS